MSRNAIKAWIKANKGPFVRHKYLNKLVSKGVETAVGETLRGEERGEEGILLGICGLAFVLTYLESSRLAHSAFRLFDSAELKLTLTSYDGFLPMVSSPLTLATISQTRRMIWRER